MRASPACTHAPAGSIGRYTVHVQQHVPCPLRTVPATVRASGSVPQVPCTRVHYHGRAGGTACATVRVCVSQQAGVGTIVEHGQCRRDECRAGSRRRRGQTGVESHCRGWAKRSVHCSFVRFRSSSTVEQAVFAPSCDYDNRRLHRRSTRPYPRQCGYSRLITRLAPAGHHNAVCPVCPPGPARTRACVLHLARRQ